MVGVYELDDRFGPTGVSSAPDIQTSELMAPSDLTCQVFVRGMQHPAKVAIPIAGK